MCLILCNGNHKIEAAYNNSVYKILSVKSSGDIVSPYHTSFIWSHAGSIFGDDFLAFPIRSFANKSGNLDLPIKDVVLSGAAISVHGDVLYAYTNSPWENSYLRSESNVWSALLNKRHLLAKMKTIGSVIIETKGFRSIVAKGLRWNGEIVSMGPEALMILKEKYPGTFRRGTPWVDDRHGKYLFDVKYYNSRADRIVCS